MFPDRTSDSDLRVNSGESDSDSVIVLDWTDEKDWTVNIILFMKLLLCLVV